MMMSGSLKILMVASSGPEDTVFESQVLDLARAWRNHGEVSLRYRSRLDRKIEVDGLDTRQIRKTAPALGIFPLYLERLVNDQWGGLERFDLIHCRGVVAAWQTLRSLSKQQRASIKILYDCRGVTVEEIAGMWSKSWKRFFLNLKMNVIRKMERSVVNEVDMLTTVSEGLSDYLFSHYGRKPDRLIRPVVNPDKFYFSEEQRNIVRKREGIKNCDKLFLFVGGADYWQSIDLLANWWRGLGNKNFTLLILTHRISDYEDCFKDMPGSSGRIVIKSVSHSEISTYMSAADFGVLLRNESVVNNVASPVKLSEYLCAGLPVLTNLAIYKNIQPNDIRCIDLTLIGADADFPIRGNSEREIRSMINIDRFSANTAVADIFSYLISIK
jgi:Glycosyltransferase Family 4